MKNTKLFQTTLVFFLVCQVVVGQRKSRADRFFEKGDYLNAALQYEDQLNSEGYSKPILLNISTAYYNTFQFKEAYKYLRILTSGKFYSRDKSYDNNYNFMMYQTLSALGEYDKSLKYLKLYQKNEGLDEVNITNAIEEIEAFKLKEEDFEINPLSVNSDASEFGAVKKDSILYFVTDRGLSGFIDKTYKWTHRSFLDIAKVTLDENNQPVGAVESISKEINTPLHEGNFAFSPDGNTIYFSQSNVVDGKKKFDSLQNNAIHLYRSQFIENKWNKPEKLSINEDGFSMMHPSISADGKWIYFTSNKAGGYGDFDLYKAEISPDGNIQGIKNLGNKINTPHRDQFPFISKEGHLFFSSNGHLGLGMMDLFVAEKKEGQFIQPVNLGAPINSSFDDFSISYFNESEGFFASNRKNKTEDDLYTFVQTGEIFLREFKSNFEVKDYATDDYVPNAKVTLINKDEDPIYNEQLDSIAAFSLNLYPGKYTFKASAEGYQSKVKPIMIKEKDEETYLVYLEKEIKSFTNDSLKIKEDTIVSTGEGSKPNKSEPTSEELKKQLLQDKEGPPVVERDGKLFFDLPPIYFDYDKWNIRADSKKVLDDFAKKLDKYKSVYIKISSHTDSRGTAEYNQLLSEKRAESTRNYLALIGYVNARRMQFKGFGESEPLINCETKTCSEEDHQTNRRSEFEIVKY